MQKFFFSLENNENKKQISFYGVNTIWNSKGDKFSILWDMRRVGVCGWTLHTTRNIDRRRSKSKEKMIFKKNYPIKQSFLSHLAVIITRCCLMLYITFAWTLYCHVCHCIWEHKLWLRLKIMTSYKFGISNKQFYSFCSVFFYCTVISIWQIIFFM